MNALPKLTAPTLIIEPSTLNVGSTEAYSRIARGAMACWFGARGRLAGSYIFHADAAPTLNGGAVEIVIHERATDQPKPWGYKAFRVLLAETTGLDGSVGGGGARIEVENLRMPAEDAPRMRADVYRWASGNDECDSTPTMAGETSPGGTPAVAPAAKLPALATKPAPKAVSRSVTENPPPTDKSAPVAPPGQPAAPVNAK